MSEVKNDGGPAFPHELRSQKVLPSGQGIGPLELTTFHGVSKRDWFAGHVMPQIALGTPFRPSAGTFGAASEGSPDYLRQRQKWAASIASEAYELADAMIAERSKP